MNWTAITHLTATVTAGVGVFLFEGPRTVALLAIAAVLFVVGIVLARRGDDTTPRPDAAE